MSDEMTEAAIIALTNKGTDRGAALAWELAKGMGRNDSGSTRAADAERKRIEAVTRAKVSSVYPPNDRTLARVTDYTAWLTGYVKAGGKPTESLDQPFGARWLYAPEHVLVNGECGSAAFIAIVARGARVFNPFPYGTFAGFGHSTLYVMDDFRLMTGSGAQVPLFSDADFDPWRGMVPKLPKGFDSSSAYPER